MPLEQLSWFRLHTPICLGNDLPDPVVSKPDSGNTFDYFLFCSILGCHASTGSGQSKAWRHLSTNPPQCHPPWSNNWQSQIILVFLPLLHIHPKDCGFALELFCSTTQYWLGVQLLVDPLTHDSYLCSSVTNWLDGCGVLCHFNQKLEVIPNWFLFRTRQDCGFPGPTSLY